MQISSTVSKLNPKLLNEPSLSRKHHFATDKGYGLSSSNNIHKCQVIVLLKRFCIKRLVRTFFGRKNY